MSKQRHYAGVVVATAPEDLDPCAQDLDALPGVEVYGRELSTGRIVIVQEADSVEGQQDLLARVRRLPRVRFVALVYHYIDSEKSV